MVTSKNILIACLCAALLIIPASATAPVANFNASTWSGLVSVPIQFNDSSTNSPTGWSWFFGTETYTQPWTLQNSSAGWTPRNQFTTVLLPDGSIVLMGGQGSDGFYNDTWRSTDQGLTWVRQTAGAPWQKRVGPASVLLSDGSILIMGGTNSIGAYLNDVWRSTDKGITWNLQNASAAWSARTYPAIVSLQDGSIILMGGAGSSYKNDVWKSIDQGITWTQQTSGAPWSARGDFVAIAQRDNSILIMGGTKNDVWKSIDQGITWTQQTSSAGWNTRYGLSGIQFPDNKILIIGGYGGGSKNDTWLSTDQGLSWTQTNSSSSWESRYDFSTVMLPNGNLILMGGSYGGGSKNDVWRFNPVSSTIQNPTNTYSLMGTYPVSLISRNSDGFSTKSQNVTISNISFQFTGNPLSGPVPLSVTFNETNAGKKVDSFYWDFGDGSTATTQNATHNYITAGIYNVNHRVINQSETLWLNKTAYIYANATVAANFTGTPTSEYLNPTTMTVSFTDTSTGSGLNQWDWNFGDGSPNSTAQNPTHAYAAIGTYNVFLKVWGIDGNATTTKNSYITVNPLSANFTTNATAVNTGDPILFTDTSLGHPNSWFWDFGDGSTSTDENPIKYSYSSAGTYTVRFRASNGIETSWKNVTNMITVTAAPPVGPVSAFNAYPSTAAIGQTIQFYDASGNTPTSWLWNFGDATTSTLKNPTHSYATDGSYTVSLTATNINGSNTLTKPGYITITPPPAPAVAFTASETSYFPGGTIQFTDQSLYSPTSWSWDFGDGVQSTAQNPAHIYTSAGSYTVSLTATNSHGSNTLTKPAYITISSTVPTIPPSSYVITDPATAVSNNTVTMNGQTISGSYKYYFEYGLYPGTYAYATEQKTAVTAGNFSETVSGLPLLADQTYYYRAVINENDHYINGEEKSYTLTQSAPLDMYPEFRERGDALIEANWDFDTLLVVIPSPFVDTMGAIFYGIIIGGAYLVLWFRTHKIVIPCLFGILSGGVLFNMLPPSWVAFGSSLFYISIGGFIYGLYVGRQS